MLISETSLRSRNKRKDDALRRKVTTDLKKKPSTLDSLKNNKKKVASVATVASLNPNAAITVSETVSITQAAALMSSKRADAVLVIGSNGLLSGILTDKDIAYRVVAAGLDVKTTLVQSVMTPNPLYVYDNSPRQDALTLMTSKGFRHLPVLSELIDTDENTNVVGLLDITKCVFDKLEDLEKKVTEDTNIAMAMAALERRGSVASEQASLLSMHCGCPEISSIITKLETLENGDCSMPEVSIRSSVRDAARIMKQTHSTAVLVLNHSTHGSEFDKLGGIFTTKDVVLRVIAAGLDPAITSVIRVMTPHPDSVPSNTSILVALKKLYVGHYMHLPVLDGQVPVGLVDVQQLTMAMLNYLVNKDQDVTNPIKEQGPMWNKFWNSIEAPNVDKESDIVSLTEEVISNHHSPKRTSRAPSVSMRAESVIEDPTVYPFKIRDMKTSKNFWVSSHFESVSELLSVIQSKTGINTKLVSYQDDDGDLVEIKTDGDLKDAVGIAKQCNWGRVTLVLNNSREKAKPVSRQNVDILDTKVPLNVIVTVGVVVFAIMIFSRLTR